MLFWGPPGSGKTTLAGIIARESGRPFHRLSAVASGVKDIKKILEKYPEGTLFSQSPIVFIDEIHRFNKAQQDALLHAVETGQIILIGATTENPGFEVNNALLSRMHTFILKPLDETAMKKILEKALETDEILKHKSVEFIETEALIHYAGGDVRKLLNALETVVLSAAKKRISAEDMADILQDKTFLYDKNADWHYDTVSAFIKSVRGSNPDAAVYWLARMLEGGEDPLFIARRLIILASEDIGLANPNALLLAQSAFAAVERTGMPEGQIILSQVTIYLATSPKSNSAYKAIKQARRTVKETGNLPVPFHLRNAANRFMKEQGYGKAYKYPHDYEGNYTEQEYFPPSLKNLRFYEPGNNPAEEKIAGFLKNLSARKKD
jgi:putative ATPase